MQSTSHSSLFLYPLPNGPIYSTLSVRHSLRPFGCLFVYNAVLSILTSEGKLFNKHKYDGVDLYYAQNGVNWSFLAQFSGTFWNFYLNLCTEFCESFTFRKITGIR